MSSSSSFEAPDPPEQSPSPETNAGNGELESLRAEARKVAREMYLAGPGRPVGAHTSLSREARKRLRKAESAYTSRFRWKVYEKLLADRVREMEGELKGLKKAAQVEEKIGGDLRWKTLEMENELLRREVTRLRALTGEPSPASVANLLESSVLNTFGNTFAAASENAAGAHERAQYQDYGRTSWSSVAASAPGVAGPPAVANRVEGMSPVSKPPTYQNDHTQPDADICNFNLAVTRAGNANTLPEKALSAANAAADAEHGLTRSLEEQGPMLSQDHGDNSSDLPMIMGGPDDHHPVNSSDFPLQVQHAVPGLREEQPRAEHYSQDGALDMPLAVEHSAPGLPEQAPVAAQDDQCDASCLHIADTALLNDDAQDTDFLGCSRREPLLAWPGLNPDADRTADFAVAPRTA